ncbi:hypothetical protein ACFWIA_22780 [Streptomyces sp. NPDC127068]|uniref:hypothetical protein n=1 Tax=Streptomyces sp. NPDC127068 TaxID=3347127 RepID=UPI00365D15DD
MIVRTWRVGDCWRCENRGIDVLWLGPVQTVHGTAPFFTCEPCLRRLEQLVFAHQLKDASDAR